MITLVSSQSDHIKHLPLYKSMKKCVLIQLCFYSGRGSNLSSASITVPPTQVVSSVMKGVGSLENAAAQQPHDAGLAVRALVSVRSSHQHLPHDHATLSGGEKAARDFVDEPACGM